MNTKFYYNEILGLKAKLHKLHVRCTKPSAQTLYNTSFAVFGATLWNIMLKDVNTQTTLENIKIHLGKRLYTIPDSQLQ